MGRRVLVVEDDEKSRRLLVDVLGYHGYDVAAVDNGGDGLRAASERAPDVALLDIQLPDITGFELLVGLRDRNCCGEKLPVVAVTASVMDTDRRKILAAGFDAFVSKPVNIGELLATIDRLLARAPT